MTVCQQNDAIYENSISSAQKNEVEHRPGMYTTLENSNNFLQDVCSYYVNIADLYKTDMWVRFDVVIQYDDFLPLLNMKLYQPSKELKIEIKNRITRNLVWCQVDPCVIARKFIKQAANSSLEPKIIPQFGQKFCLMKNGK